MTYANGADRGPELLGINIFFVIAATLIVLLRCYVRAVLVKTFGVDDWVMLLATVRLHWGF